MAVGGQERLYGKSTAEKALSRVEALSIWRETQALKQGEIMPKPSRGSSACRGLDMETTNIRYDGTW